MPAFTVSCSTVPCDCQSKPDSPVGELNQLSKCRNRASSYLTFSHKRCSRKERSKCGKNQPKLIEMETSKHTCVKVSVLRVWKIDQSNHSQEPGHYLSPLWFLQIHSDLLLYNFSGKASEGFKNLNFLARNKYTQCECKFPPFQGTWEATVPRQFCPAGLKPTVSKLKLALKFDALSQKSLPGPTTRVSELVINLVGTIRNVYEHY